MIDYTIDQHNLHITDSAFVSKHLFWKELADIYVENKDSLVFSRSINSLMNEWATHNACYALHILRSHTKDVDLNYPQKWYIKITYAICGNLGWLFIK